MNIQIFGTKKCQATRKAERWFKERGIKYQFVDLAQKGLSQGELKSVGAAVGGLTALIDKEGKEYERRNLKYLLHNVEELLVEVPLLLKTPIVRNSPRAAVGYQPEVWESWIKAENK